MLKESARYKLTTLHTSDIHKNKFKASFLQFDGYTDLFSTLESLINVCILASHVEGDSNDPGLDIRKTLELANKLLPFDEGEFLDEAYGLFVQNKLK
ncbi:hypothetical protein [uncultured Roseivirga sp.]|uniref:hypothetical protein n=1 Tax=uncultured Roseivirga sp. TaxID=543088 RepID=UPI0030D907AF